MTYEITWRATNKQKHPEDYCPECDAEIELSDWDHKYYIYCPNCGPIEALRNQTEIDDDTYILGYPPFMEDEA
jgi:predicted RNA-binding Zn-ribbon protein involved in translation (DUF1610 family)